MNTPTITLITDSREQRPLVFLHFPSVTACLSEGDYSVQGFEKQFTIERKSISDLVQSVTAERERFEKELIRMRPYDFRRLLIVGTLAQIEAHDYRSQANPKAVIASVFAFEVRYALPVCFCAIPEAAAVQVEQWAWYYVREATKQTEATATG